MTSNYARGALFVAAIVLLAGCLRFEEGFGPGIKVINRTTDTLDFRIISSGASYEAATDLAPGAIGQLIADAQLGRDSLVTTNGCTNGDVIAYARDGKEVARHGPGLCEGDTWIVTLAGSPTPS